MKWLDLMREGVFKDRFNKEHTITGAILDKIAANFKTAPVLVGHPGKASVPSFGVFEAVKRVGDKLMGLPGRIVPEFSALVKQGGFPDLSVGLNAAFDNIEHIAFLSAEKPAIDGLTPVAEFSAPQSETEGIQIIVTDVAKEGLPEFSGSPMSWFTWRINTIGEMFRAVKNYLIEKDGLDKANTILSDYTIDSLLQSPPEEVGPQFSAAPVTEKSEVEKQLETVTAQNVELSGKVAEFSASVETYKTEVQTITEKNTGLLQKVAALEASERKAEFSAFIEVLIDEGRILPDEKASEVSLLETLHAATPAEFSAANGEKSPVEQYKARLKVRPIVAPSTGPSATRGPEFSAAQDPVATGNKARAYIDEQAAKGVKVSVLDAVEHVKNG